MSEFSLIQRFFTRAPKHTDLSVGDDAALLRVAEGMQLAVSSDMLVSGTHFFADAAPFDIGWKALAVNISDMAAMGAQPKWATLALALPQIQNAPASSQMKGGFKRTMGAMPKSTPSPSQGEGWGEGAITAAWLAEFSRGFFACADAFNIDLIGGDTTRGPLNISVTMMGEVPIGKALRRDGAQVDDDIWVSGQLGSAALGLAHLQNKTQLHSDALKTCLAALHRPNPRVILGLALRGIANSCLDISDGLAQDLGHILSASKVGAEIHASTIPCSQAVKNAGLYYALAGGDDYELCFTAPTSHHGHIEALSAQLQLPLSRIGEVRAQAGLTVYDAQQQPMSLSNTGYDHFR